MSPSPAPREREEPDPKGWEGEGRGAATPSPASLALATLSRGAGPDEERPAFLEIPQGVGDRDAAAVADQHAVAPPLDRTLEGAVAVEQPAHDAGAAGVGQEVAVIADQAAGRHQEGEPELAA